MSHNYIYLAQIMHDNLIFYYWNFIKLNTKKTYITSVSFLLHVYILAKIDLIVQFLIRPCNYIKLIVSGTNKSLIAGFTQDKL